MSAVPAPVAEAPDPVDRALEVLAWATDAFGERLVLVSALGPQSVVTLALLERLGRRVDVVVIDTGLLFDETWAVAAAIEARFGVPIRRVTPALSIADQARAHGDTLWARDPDACCALRKVAPLHDALRGYDAWITGLRTSQGPSRAQVRPVSHDPVTGRTKIAPVADWSRAQVVGFLRDEGLPYNTLLDRGYASVGCRPCTRPTRSFTALGGPLDERAGRWADHPDKRECGLHAAPRGGAR